MVVQDKHTNVEHMGVRQQAESGTLILVNPS